MKDKGGINEAQRGNEGGFRKQWMKQWMKHKGGMKGARGGNG